MYIFFPFLGHLLIPQDIKPKENKIEAIRNVLMRKLIKNFVNASKPFTKYLPKHESKNTSEPFTLMINASNAAIGSVLPQNSKHINFYY